jgi:hypothetical protein
MPRISCLRALQALNHGLAPATTPARVQFASISTTAPARDLRSKLWKGEAPGPEDPYTQRSEPEQESLPSERRPAAAPVRQAPGIVLPPRRTEAVSEKDATHNDPTYTPATSIEDLMVAPSLKNWWEQPGHWGDESRFTGFAKAGKVVDRALVEVHLRRAVVEVLALQQAGKLSEWATKKWATGDANAALDILIDVAEDGTASLKTDGSALVEQLTAAEEEATPAKSFSSKQAYDAREWDSKWQDIVLNDEVKFAVSPTQPAAQHNPVSMSNLTPCSSASAFTSSPETSSPTRSSAPSAR